MNDSDQSTKFVALPTLLGVAAAGLLLASCYSGYSTGPGGAPSNCDSDSDCRGTQICSSGYCIAPRQPVDTAGRDDGGADGLDDCTDEDDDGYYAEQGCGEVVDCDDADPEVHPGATELCNGKDDDCDGSVDEDAVDGRRVYEDADDDGWGDPTTTATYCPDSGTIPDGFVERAGDCAPQDPMVHPGATELCNGEDDDCDDEVDEDVESVTWYPDEDDDGWGTDETGVEPRENCEEPTGDDLPVDDWARRGGDCNDQNADANPDGTEVCDGSVDEDCDGRVDEDCDDDEDGYCDPDMEVVGNAGGRGVCPETPEGSGDDCNDEVASINPGVRDDEGPTSEGDDSLLCNGLDDDCDGRVDEGCPGCQFDPTDAQTDAGTSGAEGVGVCGDGTKTNTDGDAGTGCEAPATFEPGTEQSCDGLDNDCDGSADDEFPLGDTCTVGEGVCESTGVLVCADNGQGTTCSATEGEPADAEICDGRDNDCDGQVDEEWDSLGETCTEGTGACESEGIVVCASDGNGTTCSAQATSPSAETCDGRDNDCDGQIDENLTRSCGQTTGVCEEGTETCNDGSWSTCNGNVEPSSETCNGDDDDCDGTADENLATLCSDQQGVCKGATVACDSSSGDYPNCTDSTYSNYSTNYESDETTCDGLDNDCDGQTDEGCDDDGDGYCDASLSCTSGATCSCTADCDDGDASVNPGVTVYHDGDGDGFGDPGDSTDICDALANWNKTWVRNGEDCDDGDASVGDEETFYEDADGDGFGNPAVSESVCPSQKTSGYVDNAGDCDDSESFTYPGAAEEETLTECRRDKDGDGYGDASAAGGSGNPQPGGDCVDDIDTNPDADHIYPGAAESENDECRKDVDQDGYGDENFSTGSGTPGGDCDDSDGTQYPGASEVCNGEDDDCDGDTDEGASIADPKLANANCNLDCECRSRLCSGANNQCAHRIFVTSSQTDGNAGGLAGLDQMCDDAADGAGLGGTWRAVASSGNDTASNRIAVDDPVVNLVGDTVSADADLWDGDGLQNSVTYDETETSRDGSPAVWTGTNNNGDASGTVHCSNWSSSAGGDDGQTGNLSSSADPNWVDDGVQACNDQARIYCIDGQ